MLLLDNFEQIVDAAADVSRLLREAPNIKLLVTTRVVLHVYGESEFPVPPLGQPPADGGRLTAEEAMRYEAIELFVDRARAVQPSFALTDETAPLVVDICRRLDGLPLAIELAAARTRALPVAAIHARLDQHLSLLTGGSRDLPGRQQTLRGAIDWSYDLLEPADRRLFERFSIHSGGAFLTQADAVCGPPAELGEDVLDGLSSLSDKSLVKPDLAMAEDPRFAMLATIRDYAHERLAATDEFDGLARRHANVYLEFVESLAPGLTGPESREVSDRFELDHDNIRAALDWATANGEVEIAMRIVVATWRFWQRRGHLDEARRRIDLVLRLPGVADQSDVLQAAGIRGRRRYHLLAGRYARDIPVLQPRAGGRSSDPATSALIARALYDHGFAALDVDTPVGRSVRAGRAVLGAESGAVHRRSATLRASPIQRGAWPRRRPARATTDRRSELRGAGARRLSAAQGPVRNRLGRVHSRRLLCPGRSIGRRSRAARFVSRCKIFVEANDRTGILLNLAAFLMIAQRRGTRCVSCVLAGATHRLRVSTGAALLDVPIDLIQFSMPAEPTTIPTRGACGTTGARMSAEEAAEYALSDIDTDKTELSDS